MRLIIMRLIIMRLIIMRLIIMRFIIMRFMMVFISDMVGGRSIGMVETHNGASLREGPFILGEAYIIL
jgi:hypothetical protein